MRALLFFCITFVPAIACAQHNVSMLQWLGGCWATERHAGSGEAWTTPTGGTLFGISRTVRNGKTTGHEFMQIREIAPGKIAFIATPSGQAETTFVAIEMSNTGVVFENKEHDFPQRVIYRLQGPRLLGRIEGVVDGTLKAIDFPMTRQACPL